jgi:hypothetical protein
MKPIYRSKDLAWNNLGENAVILTLGQEKSVHELNPVAALIWRHCNGESTVDQIAMKLAEEFEVSPEQALSDTNDFLRDLSERGLVDWK